MSSDTLDVARGALRRSAPDDAVWWGAHAFDLEGRRRVRVGPIYLEIERQDTEWIVDHAYAADELADAYGVDSKAVPIEAELERRRFAGRTSNELSLVPWLAERAIVVRPVTRFTLPRGAEISLFFSTALNVALRDGGAATTSLGLGHGVFLAEYPTVIPKETWFGPNTMEGELCFASRTMASLSIHELPFRPNRAITEVRLSNRGSDPVDIARFRVPMRHLALYWDARIERFVTEPISLTRRDGADLGAFAVGKAPTDVPRVSGPREELRVPLTGALSRLWA